METRTEPVRKKQKTLDSFLGKRVDRFEKRDGSVAPPVWSKIEGNGLNISQAVVIDGQESNRLFLQLEDEVRTFSANLLKKLSFFQVEYLTGSLAQVKVFGKIHNIPRLVEVLKSVT